VLSCGHRIGFILLASNTVFVDNTACYVALLIPVGFEFWTLLLLPGQNIKG